jgi:acyl-homoserine lactone synthase
MIEIITPDNRQLYAAEIESMYRLRYRVFVEEWGWKIPGISEGRDCDQFDTDRTVYLIECEHRTRDVVVCARLNPTILPHMYSDAFSDLCNLQSVQTGPHIYEASRYAMDRSKLSARELFAAKGRLEWTITQYSLSNSISKLTWLMSKEVYARNIQLWATTPLGLPVHFEDDDRTYVPAISDIDEEALQRVAERYRLHEDTPICMENDGAGRIKYYPSPREMTRSAA